MKNTHQHIIPKCYLKAWCDPNTPIGQAPYIWRISKDGKSKIRRSPEKSFRESNRYTIRLSDGERDLVVEETLSSIEAKFVETLPRVQAREQLSPLDRAHLCLFAAAMRNRTRGMSDHWRRQYESHAEIVAGFEKVVKAKPKLSEEFKSMAQMAAPRTVSLGVQIETPMLLKMNLSVLHTDDALGFITSDEPCVWFNPDLGFPQIPALRQRSVEVTLPLTPQCLLVISHDRELPLYVPAESALVDEANRTTQSQCLMEFVSWKGETRADWFE